MSDFKKPMYVLCYGKSNVIPVQNMKAYRGSRGMQLRNNNSNNNNNNNNSSNNNNNNNNYGDFIRKTIFLSLKQLKWPQESFSLTYTLPARNKSWYDVCLVRWKLKWRASWWFRRNSDSPADFMWSMALIMLHHGLWQLSNDGNELREDKECTAGN